jgi:hypothetical protein
MAGKLRLTADSAELFYMLAASDMLYTGVAVEYFFISGFVGLHLAAEASEFFYTSITSFTALSGMAAEYFYHDNSVIPPVASTAKLRHAIASSYIAGVRHQQAARF